LLLSSPFFPCSPLFRSEAVQTPVVPIVGRWIAATPGTISLGQGIVSYGPPPEVVAAVQQFGGAIEDHRYGPVEGQAPLVEMIERSEEHTSALQSRENLV